MSFELCLNDYQKAFTTAWTADRNAGPMLAAGRRGDGEPSRASFGLARVTGQPAAGGPDEVTRLLMEVQQGDRSALDRLLPLVYGELRNVAARQLRREREGHTLQPTALVHEAYLELAGQRRLQWQSRAHFIGIAAHLMRQILVHHGRRRRAAKRAGGLVQVTLDDAVLGTKGQDIDVVALHEALEALGAKDARLARVVELRYFGGLTIEETAEVLDIGTATVEREWRAARAWLRRELDAAQGTP